METDITVSEVLEGISVAPEKASVEEIYDTSEIAVLDIIVSGFDENTDDITDISIDVMEGIFRGLDISLIAVEEETLVGAVIA